MAQVEARLTFSRQKCGRNTGHDGCVLLTLPAIQGVLAGPWKCFIDTTPEGSLTKDWKGAPAIQSKLIVHLDKAIDDLWEEGEIEGIAFKINGADCSIVTGSIEQIAAEKVTTKQKQESDLDWKAALKKKK